MKKKVLLIVAGNKGTIGICSLNLYNALKKDLNTEVLCVVLRRFSDGFEFDDCLFFEDKSKWTVNRFIKILKFIYCVKKKFRPDISISTLNNCSTYNVLTNVQDVKIGIFHAHHKQVKQYKGGFFLYIITFFQFKYIYSKLDRIFPVSEEIRRSILKSFKNIEECKIKTVYNVHDVDKIMSMAEEDMPYEELTIFSNNNVILCCGYLSHGKAPERLLKAFIRVYNLLPINTILVFIGEDVDNIWQNLSTIAAENGIFDNVLYFGKKENPYKYMVKAKVLVSTSYYEGLPGVLIEALILNTPIIATNSSFGIWEILSCTDFYQKELSDIYVTKGGIITSNLAFKDKSKYEIDIENISKALHWLFETDFKIQQIPFKEQILGNNVIKSFLSIN